jgi:hypothetical protein
LKSKFSLLAFLAPKSWITMGVVVVMYVGWEAVVETVDLKLQKKHYLHAQKSPRSKRNPQLASSASSASFIKGDSSCPAAHGRHRVDALKIIKN